ncbi:MAG: hypothetical protein QOA14_09295 [Nitrososphaeraceae archaeon]|nr:hypothetical protein [Nitrososphaeraceae archaeon]
MERSSTKNSIGDYFSAKNFNNCSTTNFGCSSGIQCPDSGTVTPFTFVASDCKELNAKLPG